MPDTKVELNIYTTEEIHHNCCVQILTNTLTGEQSIGWWHEDEPPIGWEEDGE